MQHLYQDAEKRINEIFWNETHDPHSKLHLPKLIGEKLIADNKIKDPDYFNHRDGIVHSTSLAKCLRGVLHEMLGVKPDRELDPLKLGIFKAGNLFEDFIIASLGDRVIYEQREYEYKYKSITLVGRSDYVIDDEGVIRVGENKSVRSDSFWMREREGTLVAWHNQVQLETYLWLERILEPYRCDICKKVLLSNKIPICPCSKYDPVEHGRNMESIYTSKKVYPGKEMTPAPDLKLDKPQGIFSYISKDDCTVIGAPIKYNPHFVDEIIKPALDIINEGYENWNPEVAPLPALVIFSEAKHQFQKNWLVTYCDYHSTCAGAGWVLEATNLVTSRNKEMKATMKNPHAKKKIKPIITVDKGSEGGDKTIEVVRIADKVVSVKELKVKK